MADDNTFMDEIGQAFTHLVGVEAHLFEALGALDGSRDYQATNAELEYLRKVLFAGRDGLARAKTSYVTETASSIAFRKRHANPEPEGKSAM